LINGLHDKADWIDPTNKKQDELLNDNDDIEKTLKKKNKLLLR
jgi:hypothetical protein